MNSVAKPVKQAAKAVQCATDCSRVSEGMNTSEPAPMYQTVRRQSGHLKFAMLLPRARRKCKMQLAARLVAGGRVHGGRSKHLDKIVTDSGQEEGDAG
jgi:hypothetical protein